MTSRRNKSTTVDAIGLGYPDLRNRTVIDVIRDLKGFRCDVSVCDPLADPIRCARIRRDAAALGGTSGGHQGLPAGSGMQNALWRL